MLQRRTGHELFEKVLHICNSGIHHPSYALYDPCQKRLSLGNKWPYPEGKIALDKGDKKEALGYFKQVSEKASDSSYATMCWNRVDWMKYKEKRAK